MCFTSLKISGLMSFDVSRIIVIPSILFSLPLPHQAFSLHFVQNESGASVHFLPPFHIPSHLPFFSGVLPEERCLRQASKASSPFRRWATDDTSQRVAARSRCGGRLRGWRQFVAGVRLLAQLLCGNKTISRHPTRGGRRCWRVAGG